jgi:hypothetical protein
MPTSKKHVKLIESAIDALFERAKARLLGPKKKVPGKSLIFSFIPELTLPALFTASAQEEGVRTPNAELLGGLMSITESYLEAQKQKAKAQVTQAVHAFVQNAQTQPVEIEDLGKELADIWLKTKADVKKIVETEATIARNVGTDDAIQRISAMQGIDDPIIFFIVVRDNSLCPECKRLHLRPDGITPRVWKRSEVGAGYHRKGGSNPKIGGLHPHCRCSLSVLMPGFGFDAGGKVIWKSRSWNEYKEQNGT